MIIIGAFFIPKRKDTNKTQFDQLNMQMTLNKTQSCNPLTGLIDGLNPNTCNLVPFTTEENYYITPLSIEEIKHKGTLIEQSGIAIQIKPSFALLYNLYSKYGYEEDCMGTELSKFFCIYEQYCKAINTQLNDIDYIYIAELLQLKKDHTLTNDKLIEMLELLEVTKYLSYEQHNYFDNLNETHNNTYKELYEALDKTLTNV